MSKGLFDPKHGKMVGSVLVTIEHLPPDDITRFRMVEFEDGTSDTLLFGEYKITVSEIETIND